MASALLKYKEETEYPSVYLPEEQLQKGYAEEVLYVDHQFRHYPTVAVSGMWYKSLSYEQWLQTYNLHTL